MRYPLVCYFALAYGISWLVWAPLWLPALDVRGLPVLPFHHALGALGPIGAAFIVSAIEPGGGGPRDLLRRMGLWRGRLAWVFVALLGPCALLALGLLAAAVFEGHAPLLTDLGRSSEFPQFSALEFLAYNVVSFGFGEEVGWRGFALPRLQQRHPAWLATLWLTLGWAIWHAPLFLYRPGFMGMGVAAVIGWLFSLLTGAVLLTWLYNESRGSLLVVAIFHAGVDVAFTSDASSPVVVNTAGALITLWGIAVVLTVGRRRLVSQRELS
ncbi:MAG: CPBP family intramembrane glutamic endopeptidase [Rhizobacter sp.]